jgi:hypothetical protein
MSAEAVIRVLLTEGQRARVKDLTGRDMETLELADPVGIQGERMPIVRPDDIELLAIHEARRLNEEEDAERKWLEGLAAEQDAEATRLKELEAIQKETAKETKKEQKRQEAEFKLLAAGKKTPRQKAQAAKKKAAKKAAKGRPKESGSP